MLLLDIHHGKKKKIHKSCPVPEGTAPRTFIRAPMVVLRARCHWGVGTKNAVSAYSTHAIRGNKLDSRGTYNDMNGS